MSVIASPAISGECYVHRVHQRNIEQAHNHVSPGIGEIDDGFETSDRFGTRKRMRGEVSLKSYQTWRREGLLFDPRQNAGEQAEVVKHMLGAEQNLVNPVPQGVPQNAFDDEDDEKWGGDSEVAPHDNATDCQEREHPTEAAKPAGLCLGWTFRPLEQGLRM